MTEAEAAIAVVKLERALRELERADRVKRRAIRQAESRRAPFHHVSPAPNPLSPPSPLMAAALA